MKFTPIDGDINKMKLIFHEGIYMVEVLRQEEKISKSGNEMIEIMVKVHGDDGKTEIIYDWLLSYKLKSFCEAANLKEEYAKGEVPGSLVIGRMVPAFITIEKATGSFQTERNVIKYYVSEDKLPPKVARVVADEPFNDEVPF